MSIAIVTDSTSDLRPEQLQALGVINVPLYVLLDGQMYKDGIEITSAELIRRMQSGSKVPTTSQPSPVEFAAAYQQALEQADEVISIHISGKLSGAVGSARLAAQDFGERVKVVDAKTTTLGLGLQVIRATELVNEGRSSAEIIQILDRVRAKNDLRFTVASLEFLRLNGRIGGATALLGGLLNIKPILLVRDGRVEAGGRVRGQKKALADLTEYTRRYAQQNGGARIAYLAAPDGEADRDSMKAELQSENLNLKDMGNYQIGAVITAHVGPGAIGVALEPLSP